jgi:hypothetical protein
MAPPDVVVRSTARIPSRPAAPGVGNQFMPCDGVNTTVSIWEPA